MNSQVLVRCRLLNVCSLGVHLYARLFVPVEIHHQLFGLLSVELEVVPLAPVTKALNKFSVGFVVPALMRLVIAQSSMNFCRWLWCDGWEKPAVDRVDRKGARTFLCGGLVPCSADIVSNM